MQSEGYLDDQGQTNDKYDANASNLKKRLIKRLKTKFDGFFNPGGDGKLYTFPPERPCCNFHLDADFEVAGSGLDGLTEEQARGAMQQRPNKTLIQVENIPIDGHPHADIGGQVMGLPDVQADDKGLQSFPHEIGHILGLPDRYKTKYNNITPEQEREHQGELMGKALPNGQREISSQEAGEIAANAGLTCNFDRCCKRQAHPLHGQHPPATGESKAMKGLYCDIGFVTGDSPEIAVPIPDEGIPREGQIAELMAKEPIKGEKMPHPPVTRKKQKKPQG